MLIELGNAPVPVATTVHGLQVLESFPALPHDVRLSIIATPEELIEVLPPPEAGGGIEWDTLPAQAYAEMPILAELRELRRRHAP